MSAHGHHWLGRWKLQRCALCQALRRRLHGETHASEFSTDRGKTWTTTAPTCPKKPLIFF